MLPFSYLINWQKGLLSMMRILFTCLLASVTALAQGPAKAPQKQPPAPSNPAATQSQPSQPGAPSLKRPEEKPPEIPPGQAVITVKGLCPAETGAAVKAAVPTTRECVVTVSKEQFENLLRALNPNNQPVTPAARRQLAQAYVELLIFSEAAKAAGVENTPAFAEVMRVLRLKTMSDLYRNELAEQFRNPRPEEMEAYYQENQSKYETAKVSRVYLPKTNPDPQATAEQKQAYQTKVQHVVEDIQARAGKGEAIDKLQKDGYTALGITGAPPNTELSPARHGVFPAKLDQEIFSHKAGDVFRSDDAAGLVVYRIESRQTAPLESVKDEISREIFRRKMEEKNKELTSPVHTDYDENYFGPPAAPNPAPTRPPVPNPAK
jgi:parvulin-like peptidyl-prolyl cis-trans isomerase-like protein